MENSPSDSRNFVLAHKRLEHGHYVEMIAQFRAYQIKNKNVTAANVTWRVFVFVEGMSKFLV